MINSISEKEYQELADAAQGQTLDSVLCYSAPEQIPADFAFEDRKEIFLWALSRLLNDGRIKLAKHGKFLTGSVEVQVERFRKALPKTEAEMDDGLWFFDDRCPGGVVWVLPNGSLEWA